MTTKALQQPSSREVAFRSSKSQTNGYRLSKTSTLTASCRSVVAASRQRVPYPVSSSLFIAARRCTIKFRTMMARGTKQCRIVWGWAFTPPWTLRNNLVRPVFPCRRSRPFQSSYALKIWSQILSSGSRLPSKGTFRRSSFALASLTPSRSSSSTSKHMHRHGLSSELNIETRW